MGVPALFRWLSQKYPKIVSPVIEESPREIDGVMIPVDYTKPNPNGDEIDNLYLDMNGIVHPCSHPEDRAPPENETEMMMSIFDYTDRVVHMTRPRKLLMIAVDGVAPRAKMNQQRSRRFRSAQEAKEKDEDKLEFIKLLQSQKGAGAVDSEIHEAIIKKTWDSNAITPGTPFMHLLAECLRYWCAWKLNDDPSWAKLKVIISDASVPGEGEHKIMNFIRSQRRSPEHDPNTRHVIYGLDADLIMLGLATHEPHFRVLREDVFFESGKPKTCHLCGQVGHIAAQCKGEVKQKQGEFDEKQNEAPLKPFIWLHVSVLREYLEVELSVQNSTVKFDLERALDDWVFMCFFVGNDFLPHLPSLDIREQGIDTLITIWRDNLDAMGGYVTKDGHVNLERVQYILSGLAKQEDSIFKRRRVNDERKRANDARRKAENERRYGATSRSDPGTPMPAHKRVKEDTSTYANVPFFDPKQAQSNEVRKIGHDMFVNRKALFQATEANKSAAAMLKDKLLGRNSVSAEDLTIATNANGDAKEGKKGDFQRTTKTVAAGETAAGVEGDARIDAVDVSMQDSTASDNLNTSPSILGKRTADMMEDSDSGTPGRNTPIIEAAPKPDSDEPPPDTVRMWEEGYGDRYYEQKFKVSPDDIEFRHQVAKSYVEGLCWVLLYYMQGCPSWTWYYPYHYAPFAADFVNLADMKIEFKKGTPFRPYEQLMGVLPAASNHAIPEVFRGLMTDEDSDIRDFYPEDFELDLNGKKFAWQGVALLPFIDEKRLLAAMDTRYPDLTPDEKARNEVGKEILMFSTNHPLFDDVVAAFYSKKADTTIHVLDPKISEGLSGRVEKDAEFVPHSTILAPLQSENLPDIEYNQSIIVSYKMPETTNIHKSMLLRGVKMPTAILNQADIKETRERASGRRGGRPGGNGGYGGRGGRGGSGSNDYSGRVPGGNSSVNPFARYINTTSSQAPQYGYGYNTPASIGGGYGGYAQNTTTASNTGYGYNAGYNTSSSGSGYGGAGYGGAGYGGTSYNSAGYNNTGYSGNSNSNAGYGNASYGNAGYGNAGYGGTSNGAPGYSGAQAGGYASQHRSYQGNQPNQYRNNNQGNYNGNSGYQGRRNDGSGNDGSGSRGRYSGYSQY